MHDDLGFLRGLLDVDEPFVLVMRHGPHPAAQRLLAFLGVGWTVDPVDGVPCAKACGRRECRVVARTESRQMRRIREAEERRRAAALGEGAAVADFSVSGSASLDRGEPERAAPSPSTGFETFKRPRVGPSEQVTLNWVANGTTTAPEIAAARGCNVPAVQQHLKSLLAKGVIERVSRGVYTVARPARSRGSWIRVDGTGLAYPSPAVAYKAADEIEADGERVAASTRADGNKAKADQAADAARELAEKIRAAARKAEGQDLGREPRGDEHVAPRAEAPAGVHDHADSPATASTRRASTRPSSRPEHTGLEALPPPERWPTLDELTDREKSRVWIAALEAEASRLARRAGAFRKLVEAVRELEETAT